MYKRVLLRDLEFRSNIDDSALRVMLMSMIFLLFTKLEIKINNFDFVA